MKRRDAIGGTNHRVFPIVGIGASAGGLDAFKRFFSAIPPDSGMAFVLVQHLDPTHESRIAELVSAYTPMSVVQVRDGMRVGRNRVYVIPPDKDLSIRERTLRLSAPAAPRSLRMAIDCFLRSLAEDQREKAIGIVLAGTGTDGTLGLKEIKAAGGMTMVQDPQTVQHDGMPRSAVASGSADYVMPAEQMAGALLRYVEHAAAITTSGKEPRQSERDPLTEVVGVLRAQTKLDFGCYKKGTLERRIRRRMSLKHLVEIPTYVDLLRSDATELRALAKDLLIKVTSFFREPAAWKILQTQVIRRLVAEKAPHCPLRVWVPACATGEEAYSIAMVLIEEIEASEKRCDVQVFASDVDAEALESARNGVYPEGIAAHVSPERLSRFFVKGEHSYRVNKELRDAIVFAQQSLVSDPPFSKLDVISCRNLFIYLEPAVQERLVALLHFALIEGGYLFMGSAESIGLREEMFEAVSRRCRIYRSVGPPRHDRIQFPVLAPPVSPPVHARPRTLTDPGRLAPLVERLLLARYAPACVIVDGTGEILYFHGRTDDYLMRPNGPPTQDLVAQARNGLRSSLRRAVEESLRDNRGVVLSGIRMRRGSAFTRVQITVEPLDAAVSGGESWRLVSFVDEGEPEAAAPAAARDGAEGSAGDAVVLQQLEYELKTAKEDLQQTVEDLRVANEELMSVNEELQSSNEELETSKEELQSLNEELTTSNTALESKIAELEATNNDLDNLLVSTNIATLFLDTQLRIRRFTPAATKLFSLISSDVGRSIADITQKFTDPSLLSDVAAVLRKPATPRVEVQANDGRWYVRQVLPYRTRDDRTEGLVITFSDVAAEALQAARLYAESIVDTVRDPLLVLDADLRVRSANRSFYATFRASQQNTVGRSLYELGNRQWDIPKLRRLLADVVSRERVLNDFEVEHDFEFIGRSVMLLSARTIVRASDDSRSILVTIEDVTERRRAAQDLRESEVRKQREEQVRERQAALAHMLRVTTAGELASGLAHELSQPLSAIANGVEACARYVRSGKPHSKKLLTLLKDASGEALRAGDIVEHLRGFIQKGTPRLEATDLREIAAGVPRLLGRDIEREGITLRLDLGQRSLPIDADRIQIEQVIVNLIQNAIDAVRDARGRRKEILLSTQAVNGTAVAAVRDTGAGVSAAASERLFEPFFTTKPHGLGMGLAISRSILEAHGGRIWHTRPASGRGTTVRFALPLRAHTHARKRRPT